MNNRRIIGIGLIFSLSILFFMGVYAQTIPDREAPVAKRGVIDLSGWDLRNQGIVNLDGEWEFYEGRLLSPEDIPLEAWTEATFLEVPRTWIGKDVGGSMNRKGFGTYRLKVIVPEAEEIFGVAIKSIRMSHQLYIDGKRAGGSGMPAADADAHRPGNTPYSTFFHAKDNEIEIVIQAANFMFFTGGIASSIQFGLQEAITNVNSIQIGTDVAFVLTLFMMGAYQLSLYFLQLREKTYLFGGMYLVSLAVYQAVYGEKILLRLFPDIPFSLAYKVQDISLFASSILLVFFFSSLDGKLMSRRTMMKLLLPVFVYIVIMIVLPYSLYTTAKGPLLIYVQVVHLYILGRMIYLSGKKRNEISMRREMVAYIGASLSLTVSLIDGLLYAENLVPTNLAGKMGVLYFIVFINILLAIRFTSAFERTEILTRQLKVSNELKDEFLQHTSHEIKTPLHGIQNITQHLLDDKENNLSEKQKQNLWLIKDTSIKLSMLIRDLIDVSRLKHGELRLHRSIVDVKVVTQIVFDVLHFELLGKEVQLINEVDSHARVIADENRLRQIMYNLVHNAIKHTQRGTIKVKSDKVHDQIIISVEDSGTGIAPEKQSHIFEYFDQKDQPLPQDGYTSMGVGLYISRKLVEQMGGEIWVDYSEVGKGTRMTFTLPHAESAHAEHEVASTAQMQQRFLPADYPLDILDEHKNTILIVDDEAANIYTLLHILNSQQYNVITAFSAKEALSKMKEYPQIDLVILDVMMPEISGIELCHMLRSQYSILDLPILFATVRDTPHDIVLGYRAGANDYVTKPFDSETLIARIQNLIAMKTSIQEAIRSEHAFHQARIKPHFLYNALSSVISFCYTDGKKAAYLLSMLSQYLRYILDMDRTTLYVPLQRELELIDAYVVIEKARFGERLDFICQVDESLYPVEIPSLGIQPFVENAIRHGLFEKEERGKVTLTIQAVDSYMKVTIADDGVGMSEELLNQISVGESHDGGIGISNIFKRIHSIPGASVTIDSAWGSGTTVTMHLPLARE